MRIAFELENTWGCFGCRRRRGWGRIGEWENISGGGGYGGRITGEHFGGWGWGGGGLRGGEENTWVLKD